MFIKYEKNVKYVFSNTGWLAVNNTEIVGFSVKLNSWRGEFQLFDSQLGQLVVGQNYM